MSERGHALVAAGVASDPHLDPHDHVAICICNGSGGDRVHEADVLALANHDGVGKSVDAGMRDMEIGKDPNLRALDHMPRKPMKLPGPADPVSTAVVTPLVRQKSSASMPSEVPPQ